MMMTKTTLGVLATILPLAGAAIASPDVCDACRPEQACRPHERAERETLAVENPKLAGFDDEKHIAALRAIAALTKSRENAPSRAVAETLARSLVRTDFAVRMEAVRLLGDGQHPDVAVNALTRYFGMATSVMAKWWKTHPPRSAPASPEPAKPAPKKKRKKPNPDLPPGFEEHWAEMSKRLEKTEKELQDFLDSFMDGFRVDHEQLLAIEIAPALGRLRDDRSVDALVRLLGELVPAAGQERNDEIGARSIDTVVDALANLGARKGVEAIVVAAARSKDAKRLESIDARLTRLARAEGLDLAAGASRPSARNWREWFDRNRTRFTERLGRLGGKGE